MKSKRVLFVGSIYPKDIMDKLVSDNKHVDFAAQTLESAIITGFKQNDSTPIIISSPVIFPWPKGNWHGFKEKTFIHNGIDAQFVGSCGIPVFNKISEFFRVRKSLLKQNLNKEDGIVVYALHSPFLAAVSSISSKCGKICVIVPDLPQFMSGRKSRIYMIAKNFDRWIINRCLRNFDSFVLLSEKMKEHLPIGKKPYQVIEGIFEANDTQYDTVRNHDKVIMYSGSLGKANIKVLIEAFKYIRDSSCRLWIRGDGSPELVEWISLRSKEDNRICWLPKMEKRKLLELQHQASFLINPVFPSQLFTNYFFPSKIMEYIASGTPTLMYKLGCIPDEYDDYVFYLKEETPKGLAKELTTYLSKPYDELLEKGQRGIVFIRQNKSPQKQVQKIISLI